MASPSHEKLFVYEHLAKRVSYHPLTGLIYWKEKPKRMKGHWHFLKPAGHLTPNGYWVITIRIGGKQYKVQQHNLAWFIIYGQLPKKGFSIDHKNDQKADNQLENLRLLSHAGQTISRKHGSNLPPWVYWENRSRKFVARIMVLEKRKTLGFFNDSWKAHTKVADFAIKNNLISKEEYELLINEWKEFRGGKNG